MRQHPIISGFSMDLPAEHAETPFLRSIAERHGALGRDLDLRIGRKGHRYKDRATKLALAATREALLDAGLPVAPAEAVDPRRFGVIVSSNLGNLDTVVDCVRTINAQHVDATSPMNLPNASSNVIASTLAIWYGLKGPNLMLCNGATSGLDAVHLASTLIAAGRIDRCLVVGVEVNDPLRQSLLDRSNALLGRQDQLLRECAAALVLECQGGKRNGARSGHCRIGSLLDKPAINALAASSPESAALLERRDALLRRFCHGYELAEPLAPAQGMYGAQGVFLVAAAAHWLSGRSGESVLGLCGGYGDECAALEVMTLS